MTKKGPGGPIENRRPRLTDKTNPPSKGMSLNRSQRDNCSTEYNTPPGT